MNKFIWIFGAISGALGAIAEYLVYGGYLSYDAFGGIRLFKMFLLAVCIVFAVIAIKKTMGQISLARTLFVAVLVSMVRSIFLIGGFLITYYPNGETYEPVKKYAYEKSIEMLDEKEKTPKNFSKKKMEIEEQFSLVGYPKFSLLGSVVTAVFIGVFLGLIVAKRSDNLT